ncbi:MAG: hypothetical protein KTR27_21895 [Leptolyngbyaceae cyanobacterium MAG.088]|nr:hypothetical protein [Leptolyngbyaceae cyanobacterium MAG.088]
MMASQLEREAQQAITLIKSFSLELSQYSPESQVLYWLNQYRAVWIRDAIVEAVYQGRYKIISVQHILSLWQRRGQPVRHFTSGFEQVIAKHLGSPLHLSPSMMSHTTRPAEKLGHHDVVPLRVTAQDMLSANSVSFSNTARYGNYAGLSINAFPVESENTLVQVYQAAGTRQRVAHTSDAALTTTSDSAEPTSHVEGYGLLGKSSPIQPFQPSVHCQQLSRS